MTIYALWTVLCWFFLYAGRMWTELGVDNKLYKMHATYIKMYVGLHVKNPLFLSEVDEN